MRPRGSGWRRWLPPALGLLLAGPSFAADAEDWARAYAEGVVAVNEAHARAPAGRREADLGARLPKDARTAFERLLAAPASADVHAALGVAAEAALDLDLVADFDRARERLAKEAPERAAALGLATSRPRFLLRGLGGLSREYVDRLADVIDAVLDAYDEVFAFAEWSKVPGKKLRFRVHLEREVVRPPHFAPEFPFHSEVDFPVADGEEFRSPTKDGKFLFYGLCHELGHVIAMWGDPKREEDHHAWAHYTGVAIVEHLSKGRRRPALDGLDDVRWRSLEIERRAAKDVPPSRESREGVLALLVALHDAVGPRAIGDAIDRLDEEDRRLRVNRVRYYGFGDLRKSLLAVVKGREAKRAVERLLAGA